MNSLPLSSFATCCAAIHTILRDTVALKLVPRPILTNSDKGGISLPKHFEHSPKIRSNL